MYPLNFFLEMEVQIYWFIKYISCLSQNNKPRREIKTVLIGEGGGEKK